MVFEGHEIRTPGDLEKLSSRQLVALFQQATGKSTKKFASRAKGLKQTWAALQQSSSRVEKIEEKGRKQESWGHGLSFRLPPRDVQKEPRPGTKRRKAFELLNKKEGGLFSQVARACGWERKDAYEGIRLLNTYCGFALWHDRVGADDYRVYVVTPKRYRELVEAENTK